MSRNQIFDDPFLHMIEETDASGRTVRSLGGAHNIFAAVRAYDELLRHTRPHTMLMLREKSRVLRHEAGTGERL